ncbi:type I restriction enzyme HsdR N-terminal domain-containing protein [archaeon]|nr:type I restriction enzyme HsdR N-terminal domain-containing protein [archaeon]
MTEKCEGCGSDSCEPTITDFITGEKTPDTLAERVRQKTERFLVEDKNYSKSDIEVGIEFEVASGGETYRPSADLIINMEGKRVVIIKCIYGSLTAGERLTLSYARLLDSYQIPFAIITNGVETDVLDTVSGNVIGSGADAIPSKDELNPGELKFIEYPKERVEKEKRILAAFESIDEAMCSNL